MKQNMYSQEAFLLPAILRFSLPLMLTGILQLAYNMADSIIVGRYAGHASLAAVGSTTSIIFLIITLFNGVSVGANYMAARDFGARDSEGLSRTVHCAVLLSIILGLLACVCGLLLSPPLLHWADAPEDVLHLSVLYLRIYFLGVPALVVYNFGSALLRAVGDNETIVTSLAKDSGFVKIVGLAISNGLVALAGSVMCQQQRFFEISMGTGTIVIGLASVIIGTNVFKGNLIKATTAVVIGSVIYKACVAIAIEVGLPATDLKLITAVLFLIILIISMDRKKKVKKA